MKKALIIIFCILSELASFSQDETNRLTKLINNSARDLPADQVFLHLDRNLYHTGDTIRFQAYIRDRQTGIFETKSISLFSLLLNSDHKTIDSARFRIISSTASGWLKVPETLPFGDYSVLAFTSRMMNYDPQYVFSAPIRIDRLRPPQSQPDTKSDKSNFVSYQIPLAQPTVDLRFLPEGGTFICGIKQRLAFNAVTSTGKTLDVNGDIFNQKGEKISDFKSGQLGPGLVEFAPNQGDTYHATLNGEEFSGMKWPLPVPEKSGVTMRLNNSENGLIDIKIEGKGVTGMTYHLSLIMNNILVLSKEFKIDSLFRFKVTTEELPVGTAYITLFDSNLNPVAERLVFINENKKMKIDVSSTSSVYSRGEETELTLNTTDTEGRNVSSIVSVSVIDSISGYYNSFPLYDIGSTFLFDREFYKNLPDKIKINGLNNIDNRETDLLLMTYGWRKFTLKEIPETIPKKEIVNYDYLKITNPGPVNKSRSDLKLITIEGSEVLTLPAEKSKGAILTFDSLNVAVRQVMILPDKNHVKNVNPVRVEFTENKDFINKAKLDYKTFTLSSIDIPFRKTKESDFKMDSVIIIEQVTIKGNKKPAKVFVDKYQEIYQYASTSTLSGKEIVGCLNFEDILVRFMPYYLDIKNKKIYLRPSRTIRNLPPPALFVLDDTPLYEMDYQQLATMPASQIASVTILRSNRGYPLYGESANGGVVFVTTKAGKRMSQGSSPEDDPYRIKDDLMKPVRLFRTEIEYYVPAKEEAAVIPEFQYRPTLLWKNEVILDGKGPVKIRYPNNMVTGTVMVIVNGVSFKNMTGSNSYKYKIK
jgi:hypothetical protein